MTCSRAQQIDLADFIVDADAPVWDEFRAHYPGCKDCSRALTEWRVVDASLGREGGMSHPTTDTLSQFHQSPQSLDDDEHRALAEHVAACPSCGDELAVFDTFDFARLGEEPAQRGAGTLRGIGERVRRLFGGREPSPEATENNGGLSAFIDELLPAPEPQLALQSKATSSAPSQGAVVPTAYLELVGTDESTTRIELPEGEARIGRSTEAEVRIETPALSRFEAKLVRQGSEVLVTALHRRTDLRVGGQATREAVVRSGDDFELSGLRLRVVFDRSGTNP